jgi:hypothetical protein
VLAKIYSSVLMCRDTILRSPFGSFRVNKINILDTYIQDYQSKVSIYKAVMESYIFFLSVYLYSKNLMLDNKLGRQQRPISVKLKAL